MRGCRALRSYSRSPGRIRQGRSQQLQCNHSGTTVGIAQTPRAPCDDARASSPVDDLVDQVLAAVHPQAGTPFLKTPDQQLAVNALLDQITDQHMALNEGPLPGNYVLMYMSSLNSQALNKSGAERLLRNTALRSLSGKLPWKAMNRLTESKMFQDFTLKSFTDADLDEDGRLTRAEFWVSMLLMYGKVNSWLPLKAVPPNRQEVLDLFHFYDKDDSNTLTFEEFRCIVSALLADEQSLTDSFVYRWLKTLLARLWITPFRAVLRFLPKPVIDNSLLSSERSLGVSNLIFARKELLQRAVPGHLTLSCEFRILHYLPGSIGVAGACTEGSTGVSSASFQRPQVSLPLGVLLTFGKPRRSQFVTAYHDTRVKVVVDEQGTYYLFERVPECDPRFVQIAEAGKRHMQPSAQLLVVATCGGLAASGVALWQFNHLALLVAATLLGTLAFAVAEQVALNAMQFGNEVAALSAESVDAK